METKSCLLLLLAIITVLAILSCCMSDNFEGFMPKFFKDNTLFMSPDSKLFDGPILRKPLYFRPSINPLLRDRVVPRSRCKYIEEMKEGLIRIPDFEINKNLLLRSQFNDVESNSFTIAFKAKMNDTSKDFVLLKKGNGSPMIKYISEDNKILLAIDTVFKGRNNYNISLDCVNPKEMNEYAWVQHGGVLRFYVNGMVVFKVNLERELSAPLMIARGSLFIFSESVVEYKDIYICNSAWLRKN